MRIQTKRAYLPAQASDGKRILVDRLWPRGVSKADAHIHLWLKELAPTTELRKWFAHDVAKWPEFEKRYRAELSDSTLLDELISLAKSTDICLVYAAKDELHNNAQVIKAYLENQLQ